MSAGEAAKIEGRGVQSIAVGGRLLTVLARAAQPMMLRDLAQQADLTPAQAHAYLVSFRKLELVEQNPASGRYQLGPFALHLGIARMRSYDPLRLAGDAVVLLAEETGLMVALLVWGTHGATVIQVQEGSDQVHANVRAGAVFSLTGTASGRVFAAWLPQRIAQRHIAAELAGGDARAIGQPTSLGIIERDVAEIRARGYARTEGKPIPGVNAISAPVFDATGQLKLAVTLIGPSGLLATTPDAPQTARLIGFTAGLSAQLGYAGG